VTDEPLFACSRCHRRRHLFAKLRDEDLCADCWRDAGCPFPVPVPPDHEKEEDIRKRMLARGGSSRHQVRKGLT
jgi:hypothetical protein